MQCTSNLSEHPGDEIIAASGSFWPQLDNGVFCRCTGDYDTLFQPPIIDHCSSHNKGLVREIMLKHEAIFKYQVYELHRLYGRQRELMDEIQMRKLPTNCFVPGVQSDISQRALQQIPSQLLLNSRYNEPLAQGVESFKPSTFVPGNNIQIGSDLCTAEHEFKELKASSSQRNKFGKRLLDLELPAELFMDIDEEDQCKEKKVTKIHPVLHDPSINISNSSQKSNLVSEGTSSNLNMSCRRLSCDFDLNEPVQFDEPRNSISSMSSIETMHQDQDLSGNSRSKSAVMNEIAHCSLEEKGSAGNSFTSGLKVFSSGKLPLSCDNRAALGSEVARNDEDFINSNNPKLLSSSITTSSSPVPISNDTNATRSFNKIRKVPTVVQALPCLNSPQLNRSSRTSTGRTGIKVTQEYPCTNLNDACSPSQGSATSHVSCNTENQSTDEHYFARLLKDSNSTKSVVDLNLNFVPCSTSPEKDASHRKVECSDGVMNLDLNVMPSSPLSETEVSQRKVESIVGNSGLDNSVGQLNGIGYKSDYDGNVVGSPKLLEPRSSSSQLSALTSITSPSSSSENEEIQNHEQTRIPARVAPFNPSHGSEKCAKDDTYLDTESGNEIFMSETSADLPLNFGEENLSQVHTDAGGAGTVFVAPDSPDKKEHSPPRKESEDNQKEQLEDPSEELDRIAAEAIVSISSSGEQQCLKTCINGLFHAPIDSLNWFAGIVSSVADDVESEYGLLSDAPDGDCNHLAFKATEHFEAMKLKSTGTKVGGTFPETIMALPSLRRRGRPPRNAGSFSPTFRHVKKLTVATKTVKCRKNVGKTGRSRRKRQSKKACTNLVGRRRRVCSLSKQQHIPESEQSFVQSCLFEWGKKSKRQKHTRVQNW